ncbi:unnamed protein product [Paramecium octaurelia]|uniref:Uncharacterized protein n=1 Tax=Paramecium octaurelia TaxID=43137 RepID=A0A8S1XEX7_PAROT|nr:unnamed protein product [Paramecium octaurelia]
MNTVQLIQPWRQVSPQAIEALKSLEQLQTISNAKIVKRITTTSPIKQFFLNGRQLTVFGNNSQTKIIQPCSYQPVHQTDRVQPQHNRNISIEMLNFKQQVQDNILLQTVISKYESSPKMSTPVKNSGTQTPTMFTRNSCDNIPLPKEPNKVVQSRESKSPQVNLIQKKKLILNQILQLDNEIKLMQDEEAKRRLDPLRQKTSNQTSIAPVSIRESLEKQASTSTFMSKLNEWMKKKKAVPLDEKQDEQSSSIQNSVLRDCTFKGNLTSKEQHYESFYDRNMKWQRRVNMKKQKMKTQKSMIQLKKDSKSPNQKPSRPNSSELNCWIRGKELKQSQSPQKQKQKQNKIQQQLANKLRL